MIVVKLLSCLALLLVVEYSNACMCESSNPQTRFCEADYVVKVLVKSQRCVVIESDGTVTTPQDDDKRSFFRSSSQCGRTEDVEASHPTHVEYKVRVLKAIKGNFVSRTAGLIYGIIDGTSCQTENLVDRHTYYIMGWTKALVQTSVHNDSYTRVDVPVIQFCSYVYDITYLQPSYIRKVNRNIEHRYPKACGHCTMCESLKCRDNTILECVQPYHGLDLVEYACVPWGNKGCVLRHPFKAKTTTSEMKGRIWLP